jgi:pimeloyl-ACP methyl ester carboxylesterase
MTQPIEQTTTTADDRTLCFAEWGKPDGRPVFWLHGTPGCRLPSRRWFEHAFEDVLRLEGVRLITYDRPGYGRSSRQRGRRIADSAGDVASIADALQVDEFAVVGGSAGSAHAMAAAGILKERILRLALVAPMAPYAELGPEEWSRGQDEEVREYIGRCLEGEGRIAIEFARLDAEERAEASPDDPAQVGVFERSRGGIWGWVDDELAVVDEWGFDPATIGVPTAIWYDPDEKVLPRQHAEWLAHRVLGATLVTTSALGHRQEGDPRPDWAQLYSWLIRS